MKYLIIFSIMQKFLEYKVDTMENIKILESMLEKLDSIKNNYYSLKIDDFRLASSASCIVDRLEIVENQIISVIEQLNSKG